MKLQLYQSMISAGAKQLNTTRRCCLSPSFSSTRQVSTSLRTADTKDLEKDPSLASPNNTTTAPHLMKPSITTLFNDVDEFFDKNPFFSSSKHDLMNHFWKQMDMMDDMKRSRYLFNNDNYAPSYDIHSDNEKIQVMIDVPGVDLNDIDVNIEHEKFLYVTGSRKTKKEDGSTTDMKFEKRFNFGKDVIDSTKVLASLVNGVLTITLHKLPSAKVSPDDVKKIDVVAGSEELEC